MLLFGDAQQNDFNRMQKEPHKRGTDLSKPLLTISMQPHVAAAPAQTTPSSAQQR